jgi:hypothetical protein
LEEVYPDGRIRISESNWAGKGISERILTPAQYSGLSFVRLENATPNPSFSSPPAQPGKQREYRVRSGDKLWAIAQRELGNGNRWREITKADGSPFTEAEALNLQVGMSVYLRVSYQTGSGIPVTSLLNNQPTPIEKGFFFGYEQVNNTGWQKVLKDRNDDFESQKPTNFLTYLGLADLWSAHYALAASWKAAGWTDAAELLFNYLDEENGGANYYIDLDKAIRESANMAQELFGMVDLTKIKEAIRQGYRKGGIGNTWQPAGHLALADNLNWLEALGAFQKRYSADFEIDPNTNIITLKVRFFTKDIYDFDGFAFGLTGSHNLHLAGFARAFENSGESNLYTWKFTSSGIELESPPEFKSARSLGQFILIA